MSWGERSCFCYGDCMITNECSTETCNVDCRLYHWDGITKPDSTQAIKTISANISKINKPQKYIDQKWNRKKGNKLFPRVEW